MGLLATMDYVFLRAVIDSEPLNDALTDEEVLSWLFEGVDEIKSSMTGDEVFQQTDSAEFVALTDAKKSQWLAFCGRQLDPGSSVNESFVGYIFGGPSQTGQNLVAARIESVPRWASEGITEEPNIGDVTEARL